MFPVTPIRKRSCRCTVCEDRRRPFVGIEVKSSPPLKLVRSRQLRSPVQAVRIPHLRNWLALTVLTGLYSYVVLAMQGGLHLVVAPLVIAPLAYHAFKGRPFIRKALSATIPWAGAPVLVTAGLDNAIEAVFVHSFLIGMVVVQVWEAALWLGRWMAAKLVSLATHRSE